MSEVQRGARSGAPSGNEVTRAARGALAPIALGMLITACGIQIGEPGASSVADVSSSNGRSVGAGGKVHLDQDDLVVVANRLYVNATIYDVPKRTTVTFHLRGPGAPERAAIVDKKEDDAPHMCMGHHSVGLTQDVPTYACGWDLSGPGEYFIEAMDGASLGRSAPISVMNVSDGAGKPVLGLDPGVHALRPATTRTFNGTAFAIMVPIDVRHPARLLSLAVFSDGALAKTTHHTLQGPSLGQGPLAKLAHASTIADGKDVHVVALLDAKHVLGGWTAPDPSTAPPKKMATVPDAWVASAKADAAKALAAKTNSTNPLADDAELSRSVEEQTACAVATDPKAFEAMTTIRDMGKSTHANAYTINATESVLRSDRATTAQKAEAKRQRDSADASDTTLGRHMARAHLELGRLAKKQKKGCLKAILPAAYRPFADVME